MTKPHKYETVILKVPDISSSSGTIATEMKNGNAGQSRLYRTNKAWQTLSNNYRLINQLEFSTQIVFYALSQYRKLKCDRVSPAQIKIHISYSETVVSLKLVLHRLPSFKLIIKTMHVLFITHKSYQQKITICTKL